MIEMEVTFDNIANDFELRVSREWYFARKHNIKDDSQRPDIDFRVVVLKENFGCDVVRLSS